MSSKPTAKQVLSLFDELPPAQQQQVLLSLSQRKTRASQPTGGWLTLDEAAEALGVHKSNVSRAAASGKLLTNGKAHKELRILTASVITLLVRLVRQDVAQLMRMTTTPSEQAKLAKFDALMAKALDSVEALQSKYCRVQPRE
jgi:hypothetical protein